MGENAKSAGERRARPYHPSSLLQAWLAFAGRRGRMAALVVFVFGVLVHAVLSHAFSTTYADEIEVLLAELYVFQCVPLEPNEAPTISTRRGPAPTPLAGQLRELDVTSVRVLLIERAVQGLGRHRQEAARIVADVLRYDLDLNTRAGAVLALSYMGAEANPAVPELLDTLADAEEDIRLRRLILDKLPDIDPAPDIVIPILVAMRDDESDSGLRSKAAKALEEIGPAAGR
jgi:hypothetical protein